MPFFPRLPLVIPFSPGLPHWWDPEWWLFQIIVMTVLLTIFRNVATSVDRQQSDEPAEAEPNPDRPR